MARKQIRVGILGLGSIGSGVIKLLQKNHAQLLRRSGVDLVVSRVAVRNPRKARAVAVPARRLTRDPRALVCDSTIDIVVELMGGVQPAKTLIEMALRHKKYVVTANKELIAKHGFRLFQLAARQGADLYYEASVAGSIPIIRTLKLGYAADQITEISGIINGTTNHILSQMDQKGRTYQDALREAQRAGYAEANPAADVQGMDAAYKLAILASIAFHAKIAVASIHREGITELDPIDLTWARRLGYVVKLLARAAQTPRGLTLSVCPTFISRSHPLANVSGVYNAVFLKGNFVGDAMLYGRGAGSEPTAAAVVSDILDIVYSLGHGLTRRNLVTSYRAPKLLPLPATQSQFYLRVEVFDKPGVLAQITQILGRYRVSVAVVEQQPLAGRRASLVIVTHQVVEKRMQAALQGIRRLASVHALRAVIRVA